MKVFMVLMLLVGLAFPVSAAENTVPPVTGEAATLMPESMPGFGEGLLYIAKTAIRKLRPEFAASCQLCMGVIGIAMLISVLNNLSERNEETVSLAGVLAMGVLLWGTADNMIHVAAETVQEISSYGKLLLPAMTAVVAAQGGGISSAAIYTGTAFFDAILGTTVSSILVPMVYLFLALVIGHCAIGEDVLKQLRDFLKWLVSWSMKSVLYIFTGYMSITSVISGGTDKAALKAAKLAISGTVPVVGGIMSDASETILLGAGVVKNAAGIYGILAIVAILVLPFLRVGLLYVMMKGTAAICSIFSPGRMTDVVQGFSEAMGFLLGMTGTVSLLFLISIVCFIKGAGI